MTKVSATLVNFGKGLGLPARHSAGAAGMDLMAAISPETLLIMAPGERMLVPTGIAISLPEGLEAQVRSRSGLALKYGMSVLNAPGTIDCDYRGEIGVVLMNHGREPFTIKRGDRIAQLVIAPVVVAELVEVECLEKSVRGSRGFGSTGTLPEHGAR
jgi:dUTP pyrophosphatase